MEPQECRHYRRLLDLTGALTTTHAATTTFGHRGVVGGIYVRLTERLFPKNCRLVECLLENWQFLFCVSETTIVIKEVAEQPHAIAVICDGAQHMKVPHVINVSTGGNVSVGMKLISARGTYGIARLRHEVGSC